MANAYTSTSAVPQLVVTAYDKLFEFALRSTPLFRSLADKRPANVTNSGESVVFNLWSDLAVAITPLSETVDPDAVALSPTSQVTVTLNEYGNATLVSKRLMVDALSSVDEGLANIVAFNCADSVDTLVQNVLNANGTRTFVRAAGAGTYSTASATPTLTGIVGGALGSGDYIRSQDIRTIVATMRTNKVVPRKNGLFWSGIHPMVSADLRSETGNAAWRDPHVYNAPGQIWSGEIGEYEGCFFVENPRCLNTQRGSGAGGSQIRVFNTFFAGQQALAEAVNVDFGIVVGEVTDKLRRAFPLGWYGFAGWNVYRQDALVRYFTSASGQQTT